MENAESILKALGEPVLLLDGKLRAVMANDAFYQVFRIPPEQWSGDMLQEFVSGSKGLMQLMGVVNLVAVCDGQVENAELTYSLPDETQIVLMVNARRISCEHDPRVMILIELRDITKERNAERKIHALNHALENHVLNLQLVNKELESFSHSVSHDLRTPLRLMNKVAHILLSDNTVHLTSNAREIVGMIIDGTREMEKLIAILLAFSRVISNPIKKHRVDMQRLAQEAFEELQDEQVGRVVELKIAELPPCQGDQALFKQLFLNLVSNSLKFTRPRICAEITIGHIHSADEIVYFVRDNGVGFDMTKSDCLFVAFHRLHKSSEFEGSGVGLALVRRIIERHGGRIWCESEIDIGTTFFFTLGKCFSESSSCV